MVGDWLSVASSIAALIAIVVALLTWRDNRRGARLAEHYDLINAADCMIGQDKNLLRFRGIDPDSIELEYGVTASELGYLLQAFNAGSISFLIRVGERSKERSFPEGDYWYDMLRNEPTQRAFPLVRQLFDSKNPFIACCDATIRGLTKRQPETSP